MQNKIAINSARNNIEFTFMVILLKNMNSTFTYLEKKVKLHDIDKIQKEYNYNTIFILQLQHNCFGSVREQLTFVENKMSYFMDTTITQEMMEAMDSIIMQEQTKRRMDFETFLSVWGFLITIFLGLDAIHDTLSILRKSNFIINRDIPVVTINNCSIIIWILLIVVLAVLIFVKNRK